MRRSVFVGPVWALALCAVAVPACIVVEDVPKFRKQIVVVDDFATRCEAQHYDQGIGCVLACGADTASAQRPTDALLRFAGSAVTYTPTARGFDALSGKAIWQSCVANRFGGVECSAVEAGYTVACGDAGVELRVGDEARVRGVFPSDAVDASVVPSLMAGRFQGDARSCLAACAAVLTQGDCGACGDGEGCLSTAFGEACFRRGTLSKGAPCGAAPDCKSLKCDEDDHVCR